MTAMGDVLPFMELEGYRKLKEMEDANLRLYRQMEDLMQKLETETILRKLYEELSKNRLRKMIDLQERLKHGEKENGRPQDAGG